MLSQLFVEFRIVSRYLAGVKKDGYASIIIIFSLIGITLGVAALIVVMSVMNGFREELVRYILGVNGHITVYSHSENGFDDYSSVAKDITSVTGIIHARPFIEGHVMASSGDGKSAGVLLRGVQKEDLETMSLIVNPESSYGSLDQFGTHEGIALASGLATSLRVHEGDFITLISPVGQTTPFGFIPSLKSYRVLYIFQTGMFEYDRVLAYLPLLEAAQFLHGHQQISAIEVDTISPDNVDKFLLEIRKAINYNVYFSSWKKNNQSLIDALEIEKSVMRLILTLIIFIAALNIVSGLVIFVNDKSRDIAILRTIGMNRAGILRIFLYIGLFIGIVGTVLGVSLGAAFSINIETIKSFLSSLSGVELFDESIYFFTRMPSKILITDVLSITFMSLLISFCATLYPAWKASGMNPVCVLRNE